MTSPNPDYNELLSLTVQELEDVLFDQISKKNATSALAKEHGNLIGHDGGPAIAIPIMFAENGSYKRYNGPEQLNTTSNDVFSTLLYPWCQNAMNIQAHGRELLQNMGKSQRRNLIKSRVMNAKVSWQNAWNADLLSDGALPNQIGGFDLLIADDPTTGTVGGVPRGSFSFMQNQLYRAITDGGATITAANIVGYMDQLDLRIGAWKGQTKAILSDEVMFAAYEGAVHPLQRLNNEKGALGRLGFRTYIYKDAEVVYEPQSAGMPAATQMWLDPECYEIAYHTERNLVRLPKRDSWNQDAQIEYLAWMGNACARNFRRLGKLINT